MFKKEQKANILDSGEHFFILPIFCFKNVYC